MVVLERAVAAAFEDRADALHAEGRAFGGAEGAEAGGAETRTPSASAQRISLCQTVGRSSKTPSTRPITRAPARAAR